VNPSVKRVVDVLDSCTPFGESIVRRQTERLGFSVDTLPDHLLPQLVSNVLVVMKVYLELTSYAVFEERLRLAILISADQQRRTDRPTRT
jgi:hypothetical protein